ncbi:hypothetical protein F2Q70_00013248 [Brassica cretica]|uniref:Uncharacterized protein n=1 Tax=Brassica cretica TaxID=69181 RepID=A0A8S9LXW8_BRACR|nr:hypothetical protein F2Q70_00013248 [Brassica cretica]
MSYTDQNDVLEASHFWKHDGLEARRFRIMTFFLDELFRETSYQWNIISKTLEAGRELSRTGSKHDGIEARRENPKLDENPNFSIMEVFDQAKGSENIYRQESRLRVALGKDDRIAWCWTLGPPV